MCRSLKRLAPSKCYVPKIKTQKCFPLKLKAEKQMGIMFNVQIMSHHTNYRPKMVEVSYFLVSPSY
jgi:hypothetical protein